MALRSISLRAFITIPFLLLFLAAASTIGVISYRNAQQATRQLVAEVGARIHSHLRQFFAAPATVIALNLEAMRSGRLDPHSAEAQMARFTDQIRSLPHLTWVSFSGSDALYVAATRPPDDAAAPQLMTVRPEHDPGLRLHVHALGVDGRPLPGIDAGSRYDPRERPYFLLAAQRQAPFWYPVNRYRAYDSLGVGIAAPIRGRDGALLGVFAADVALVQIARYLQGVNIGRSGVAFVAEGNGDLLAASTADPVYRLHEERFSRVSVIDHPDPVLRAAGSVLAGAGGEGQHVLRAGDARYLLDLRRFADPHGLDLWIGVVLPEREFTAVVEHGAQQALVLTILAIAIGAVIGLGLTHWIASPVEHISDHARRLALGELGHQLAADSPVREINQLTLSFDKMAADLRDLIDRLEARVAERTHDLEEANRELERLSTLDGLTRVANRRAFDATLQREWDRARRGHAPLSLLLIDVDEFKAFNDHFGHQRGDDALREVAACIAARARRPGDLAARYGGEEFAIILADTDLGGALGVAEGVRLAVREAAIGRDDSARCDRVTVSIGVATLVPMAELAPRDLIEAADRELYRAKDAGRDRVRPQPE